VLRFVEFDLDVDAREAHRGGRTIELTTTEFSPAASVNAPSAHGAGPRPHLEHVWSYDFEGESNVLEVYGTVAMVSPPVRAA